MTFLRVQRLRLFIVNLPLTQLPKYPRYSVAFITLGKHAVGTSERWTLPRWPLWCVNDNNIYYIRNCSRKRLFQDSSPVVAVAEEAVRKSKRERKRDKAAKRELKQQKKKEQKKEREADDQWVNDIDRNNANFEKYYRVRAPSSHRSTLK